MEKAIEIILKTKGLKMTTQRVEILKLLMNTKNPLPIESIRSKIAKNINTTTIYRTLETLVTSGIIYQTDFRDGKAYFEFQQDHHHHIVCTSCGKKEKTDFCINKLLKNIQKNSKSFTSINGHILEFFGLCKKCQN